MAAAAPMPTAAPAPMAAARAGSSAAPGAAGGAARAGTVCSTVFFELSTFLYFRGLSRILLSWPKHSRELSTAEIWTLSLREFGCIPPLQTQKEKPSKMGGSLHFRTRFATHS